ncbi:MAG: FKBP-type peptidyl-prolyl cis-trans isomerase [Bacteroidota bacterium]
MRLLKPLLALLFPLALLSGTPALVGCDSGEETCANAETEIDLADITPDGTTLGDTSEPGDCITVNYVGRLADGSGTFDEGTLNILLTPQASSRYRTAAGLIRGFVLGLEDMQVRESRRVTIPPLLGYNLSEIEDRNPDDDRVGIPSCSTLEFDITLTAINRDIRTCEIGF